MGKTANSPTASPGRRISCSVAERLKAGYPAIRLRLNGLDGFLRQGRYLTQHETGTTSSAFLNPSMRRHIERILWPDREPPIYGYLKEEIRNEVGNFISELEGNSYGPIRMRLRREVLDRATVTVGDSLGHVEKFSPDTAEAPVSSSDSSLLNQDAGNKHLEIQVFGGLTPADVEAVDFDREWIERFFWDQEQELFDQVCQQLEALDIPWRIAGSSERGLFDRD